MSGVELFAVKPEDAKYAEEVLRESPPGSFLLKGTAEEKVKGYFKMDKATWLAFFAHDYSVAFLRRDSASKESLARAYANLAAMLDWPDREPWLRVEEAPRESAKTAANVLFDFYCRRLRVEGWRNRVEEGIREGEKRLRYEPGATGERFRSEFGRLLSFKDLLEKFEREARGRDRVGLWLACEVRLRMQKSITDRALRDSYVDYLLDSLVAGGEPDRWVEEALWLTHLAAKRVEEHFDDELCGSLECEDLMILAAMAADHVEPVRESDLESIEKYLRELAHKLVRPELVPLYYTARFGPEEKRAKYYVMSVKSIGELDEGEKKLLTEQRKASSRFYSEMARIVERLLGRRGCEVNVYANPV
jgi:hypothetical protein